MRLQDYPCPKELKQLLDKNVENITSEKLQTVYTIILNAWKDAKRIDVTQTHYLQFLKFALYLEEYQCDLNMKEYDLLSKSIIKTNANVFRINADDEWLEDEKPPIREGDLFDVVDIEDGKVYTLRIVNFNRTSIAAGVANSTFMKNYSQTKLYDIRFKYQNYPIRCNHLALWLAEQRKTIQYLFPNNLKPRSPDTYKTNLSNITFFNKNIEGNFEQTQAMLSILNKSSYPYPYILYGPPGTGKTATIVEAICQIIERNPANKVLVCTPSNTAADEVTKRLLVDYKRQSVFRLYSITKDPLTIDEKILPYCNCKDREITFVNLAEIVKNRIVITTLCTSMTLNLIGLRNDHFSHVIIDEAGQCTEPDILIPFSLASWNKTLYSQIVLAGDPKQLGPTVMSKLAKIVLGRSILERLMSYPAYKKMSNGKYNSRYITKLLVNYRNHPDIIKISNELFYNNELTAKSTAQQMAFPVIFYSALGREEKCQRSISSYNLKEVHMVVNFIEHIIENKEDWDLGKNFEEDIGVVTPFKLQRKEIKRELLRRNILNINVGTVELFQAQEKKIIIISTVRTITFSQGESKHIGFLSNPKRFNVAVTRAKSKLIVFGNPYTLQTDPSWGYLLKYCYDNGSYYGVDLNSISSDDGEQSHSFEKPKLVRSSDIFKWNKFKIFPLDQMDSEADITETMNMILNSEMNTARLIQPIRPTPAARIRPFAEPFPELKPIHPTPPVRSRTPIQIPPTAESKDLSLAQIVKRTFPIEPAPSPKLNPVHLVPPVKTTISIPIWPTPEAKVQPIIKPSPFSKLKPSPKVNLVHLTPPFKITTRIPISPTPEAKVQPMIKPSPSSKLTSSAKINPVHPIPPAKITTPIPFSPISEAKVHPVTPAKITTPIPISPIPEAKVQAIIKPSPSNELTPCSKMNPLVCPNSSVKPANPVQFFEHLPTIPSTPPPEINLILPAPDAHPAPETAAPIQLEPIHKVQRNCPIKTIKPKDKKKKCCAIQ